MTTVMATVLALTGCNIFNPSGEGPGTLTNPLEEGKVYYRNREYGKAMEAFAEAIRRDSANSLAYYNYSKAVTKFYGLDKIGILNDLDSTQKDTTGKVYFLKEDNPALMTNRLTALSKVKEVLAILQDRDSLTRWYQYTLLDSSEYAKAAEKDTSFYSRKNFMETVYLINGAQNSPGLPPTYPGYRHPSQFPLSDMRMPFSKISIDVGAFNTVFAVTRVYDFDRNGIIDFGTRDSMSLKLGLGGAGGLDSLASLAGDLESDSTLSQDINAILLNASGDLSVISNMFADLAPASDSSSSGQTQGNVDSVVKSLGSTLNFFLLGDKTDNDGDGCIDEELLDGKDNDLDGFVDEDSRVIPANKPDGVDNNLDGRLDPLNPTFPLPPGTDTLGLEAQSDTLYPLRPYLLGFVRNYLMNNDNNQNELTTDDGGQGWPIGTTWVKIKKDSPDMDKRFAVQADSLIAKRLSSGRLPDSLAAKLSNAKNLMGGCWRNLKTVSQP